jgi:photosystem II stability/assembly factor-like uncharacterized protein
MRFLLSSAVLVLAAIFCQTANAEWIKQTTNSFAWYRDIHFLDHKRGWIVGSDGVMLSTIDGGATWLQAKKFTTDAFVQIYFENERNGWLLCERNIYARGSDPTSYLRRTTDGGLTWEKIEFQEGGRERVTKLLFHDDGRATAFGEGGVFFGLQEDRTAWKKSQTAIHYLLIDGGFANDRVGAIVGTGGTILFTEDAGFTWEKATLLGDLDTRFNAVDFAGKFAWAVGSKGRVFRSNGARLWRQMGTATTANLNDVYFISESNGWAVGDNGVIVRTRDGGLNWNEVSSRTTHKLEKVIFNNGRGWAIGFGGTVLMYEDASSTDKGVKPILMRKG